MIARAVRLFPAPVSPISVIGMTILPEHVYMASAVIGSATAAMIQVPIEGALVLALVVSIAAQCGDLVQSAIKRRCNTKDSGRIVPGHGGLMDRLDSLVFAAPVFSLSWTVMTLLAADG